MKVLVGYLIDGKFNGIDRYLMTMQNYLQDTDVQMDIISYYYNLESLDDLLAVKAEGVNSSGSSAITDQEVYFCE